MVLPNSLARNISPPPTRKPPDSRSSTNKTNPTEEQVEAEREKHTKSENSRLAAIEAGEAQVRDHLEYFSHHLRLTSRDTQPDMPRITIDDFQDLYRRNHHPNGCHFVIHQHDHPISGNACKRWLYSTCRADQGKAYTTTCGYSSRTQARSASPFRTVYQEIPIPQDQIEWQ